MFYYTIVKTLQKSWNFHDVFNLMEHALDQSCPIWFKVWPIARKKDIGAHLLWQKLPCNVNNKTGRRITLPSRC